MCSIDVVTTFENCFQEKMACECEWHKSVTLMK